MGIMRDSEEERERKAERERERRGGGRARVGKVREKGIDRERLERPM